MNNFFRENGFVVIKNLYSASAVKDCKYEAVGLFNNLIWKYEIEGSSFEQGLMELFRLRPDAVINAGKQIQSLPELYGLCVNKALLDAVEDLGLTRPVINTKPVLFFHNKNLAKEDVYYKTPPHQDYATTQGSINSVVAWLPLSEMSPELGYLEVVPGSHLKGAQWVRVDNSFGLVEGYEDKDFVPIEVAPGDVILFSTFLVHRSGNNTTDSGIRWSANFRYTDANCLDWLERDLFSPYVYKSQYAGAHRPSEAEVRKWYHR